MATLLNGCRRRSGIVLQPQTKTLKAICFVADSWLVGLAYL